jgi:N-acetylneuraminic acid mutarotase
VKFSLLFVLVGIQLVLASTQTAQATQPRRISFAERVAYQYAIEEVYWQHRIWPKDNPNPKPPLDAVMSRAQIERKVEDYLHDSQLLADRQQRPITPSELQAEMDRIVAHTKQPDVLRELLAALNNDPFVIAECLARPVLANRLVHGVRNEDRGNLARIAWQKQPLEYEVDNAEAQVPVTMAAVSASQPLPVIASPSDACTDDTWTPTDATSVPDPRDHHTEVWTGSEMIVWGGNDGGPSNTGGRYNPSTDSWTATSATNSPSGRSYHTAVWTGSEMIVWGGLSQYLGTNHFWNTGGRYNPITDTWTATSTINAPAARSVHTAVWTGSEMIVWGGESPNGILNTGGRYNPSFDSWTATSTTNAPSAREAHTAVWTGSEMIVWGGSSCCSGDLNTGGRYNPSFDSWTATSTTNAPSVRDSHTAVWTGSEMIVWGGMHGSQLNTGGRYDPSADSWTPTSTSGAPSARFYHTAVWSGSEMIVWGGGTFSSNYNTGGRYNPSTDSWVATSTTNAPGIRSWHATVWTGSEMIVWGGFSYTDGFLNTGGRYDPSADSWIATSTTNAPTGRYFHTAVWTGSEVIIWGGINNSGGAVLNTGGTYTPSTDSWAAASTTNAPSARDYHSAVWSGSEMIVWGGRNFNSNFNTGGRYNPSTDSWVATSTTNAPSARGYHTAVWTGSEMIVWGGGGQSGYLNTGGKYDPSSDSWTPTSITGTTNAPSARGSHTAVWTGSEMIVWGGNQGGVAYLNTGGRYNPSTHNWQATSTTNAPSARDSHTAVWTGSEMIVWGGNNNGNSFNTGGRYNPSTDNWQATSTTNAPSARFFHTAVWTGSEMIVWGGYDGLTFFDTGGRYNPLVDDWTSTSTSAAPSARWYHTAVWSGSQMIIWGGGANYIFPITGGVYCAQPSAPIVQSAASRKTHGGAGNFDINLPLSGTPGIECRSGGATNDYTLVVTFSANISVNGSPQAAVTSGTGVVGSGGVSNGGMVTISGNVVTIPLTNVANAQTINVTLFDVNGSTNVLIPMSILIGDTNANGTVNAADVAQTKARLGQTVDATNFRSDVNANGSINAADTAIVKQNSGTSLPP